ncbi:MAG: rhodanese-like domain-containing protein [Alphaproteobacteria bacterium]|nr:rhodanese-like domain-containing protein [Alphaproteobacteria bacterium]
MLNLIRLMAVVVLLSLGLASQSGFAMDEGTDMLLIEASELQEQLGSTNPPFLLDVREPSEFETTHIKGATLIPLGTLPDHLSEIPKDRRVVVYCRSGHRSARAVSFLKQQGFTKIENLSGGMNAWTDKCSVDKAYC